MNVLYASAEVSPFSSSGGLAEVAGSLPLALRSAESDVRVITPLYGFIDYAGHGLVYQFSFPYPHRSGPLDVHVHSVCRQDVRHYFLQCEPWFGAEGTLYLDQARDATRFILFCQLTLACAWELRQRDNWFPDVLHANDWHCALIPFLLSVSRSSPDWASMRSLLTIHNLAYQGHDAGAALYYCGIPTRSQPDLVYQDLEDNLLAIGIASADVLTTVSPRYAAEIQSPEMGRGLDGLIRTRSANLHGILNGIDRQHYNPETDRHVLARYGAVEFSQSRCINRRDLQRRQGLDCERKVPLVAMVGRLDVQKGLHLALPVMRRLLTRDALQFISLGSGDPRFHHDLALMAGQWPERVAVHHDFDSALASQIYSGADLFLMPSLFEPCGIGQLLAMRYGSLPLVRETGGLADTVVNYDDGRGSRGTGFVFGWSETEALAHTLEWAIRTWHNRPAAWRRMQERAMKQDFGWDKSARATKELYRDVLISEVHP